MTTKRREQHAEPMTEHTKELLDHYVKKMPMTNDARIRALIAMCDKHGQSCNNDTIHMIETKEWFIMHEIPTYPGSNDTLAIRERDPQRKQWTWYNQPHAVVLGSNLNPKKANAVATMVYDHLVKTYEGAKS